MIRGIKQKHLFGAALLIGLIGNSTITQAESIIAALGNDRALTRCERAYEQLTKAQPVIDECRLELTQQINDYDRIAILETLGKLYLSQTEYAAAMSSWREATQYVPPTKQSPEHVEIWARLHLLIGQTYAQQRQVEQAEDQFEKTLARVEATLGKYSLPAGLVQDAIGTSLALVGKKDEALAAFNRARIVHEIRLGKLHPRTIETRLNHAVGLLDLGLEDDARAMLEVVASLVNGDRKFDSKPIKAEILTFLATLQMRNNELLPAAGNYQTAFEIRATVYGPEDIRTSQSLNNLGVVLYRAGDFKRAEVALSRAYIIRRDKLGEKDPLTLSSQKNLQAVIQAQQAS